MDTKKELRQKFSAIRKAARSPQKDDLIAARLLSLDRVLSADTVLLYASFGSEVSTWKLAADLLQRNIAVAFPKCENSGIMRFHVVTDLSELCSSADGKYGIREPDESLPEPHITDRTVCIIPGLAFTPTGSRLGYGGGYYDRFLAKNSGIYTIAPAYGDIVTDTLPTEEHDIRINTIVTEERLVLCNE